VSIETKFEEYLASLPEPKQTELRSLHRIALDVDPVARLWFCDGTDTTGKIVANPQIGYGEYTIAYADGHSKAMFRVGLSANKTGISVYIMGLKDKDYLRMNVAPALGKASVTAYCVRFKSIKEIDVTVLKDAIRHGLTRT
jgi:hypothetical protein